MRGGSSKTFLFLGIICFENPWESKILLKICLQPWLKKTSSFEGLIIQPKKGGPIATSCTSRVAAWKFTTNAPWKPRSFWKETIVFQPSFLGRLSASFFRVSNIQVWILTIIFGRLITTQTLQPRNMQIHQPKINMDTKNPPQLKRKYLLTNHHFPGAMLVFGGVP